MVVIDGNVIAVACTIIVVSLYGIRAYMRTILGDKYLAESKKLQLKINQAKNILQDMSIKPSKSISDIGDIKNMSLDEVVEALGFDKEELNNPLVRPIIEKAFNKLKEGKASNVGQEEIGY